MITAITTCKGRLCHLETTLPIMLEEFKGNVLVVDWSCPDKAGEWAFKQGAKVVFKPNEEYYSLTRSRNFGASFCESTFYVFIDADTYLMPGTGEVIRNLLSEDTQLLADRNSEGFDIENLCGFIGVSRKNFWSVGGYNEALKGWGIEDLYLRAELMLNGIKVERVPLGLLGAIKHFNDKRQRFQKDDIVKSSAENFKMLSSMLASKGILDIWNHPEIGQIMCKSKSQKWTGQDA